MGTLSRAVASWKRFSTASLICPSSRVFWAAVLWTWAQWDSWEAERQRALAPLQPLPCVPCTPLARTGDPGALAVRPVSPPPLAVADDAF